MFAYQTPKVVKIQDRTLGLLRITLMLAIFIYIFVFNIWYKGQHFVMSDVDGIARLQWQEPTTKWCSPMKPGCESNFDSTADLSYCQDYTGAEPELVKHACDFYDAEELPVDLRLGVLLPTRKRIFKQVKTCDDLAPTCRRKFSFVDAEGKLQTGDDRALPTSDAFIADIDHFTVLIDHSFRTANGKTAVDDFRMQGSYTTCNKERTKCETEEMFCVEGTRCAEKQKAAEASSFLLFGGKAKQSSPASSLEDRRADRGLHRFHRRAASSSAGSLFLQDGDTLGVLKEDTNLTEHFDDDNKAYQSMNVDPKKTHHAVKSGAKVVSIKDGDVFSLKTLLNMAGLSLEDVADPDADKDSEDYLKTIRDRGTVIVINIKYDNKKPWQLLQPTYDPWYTVSVTRRPVTTFKDSTIIKATEEGRLLEVNYGVYMIIQQTGTIATFDAVNLLMTLAAAMTLLAASNMLTDMLALYVLPRKDVYQDLKYQVSDDYVTVHKDSAAAAASSSTTEKI